jgi:hypothetical protein
VVAIIVVLGIDLVFPKSRRPLKAALATAIKSVNVSNIDRPQWNRKIMMVPSPPAIGRYR